MRRNPLPTLIASVALSLLAVQAVLTQTAAPQSAAPQMPPMLVPNQVVDLMTADGMAVFRAQWRTMEARVVEGPALPNAMAGYKTSYDISPHAGEAGFRRR